MVIPNIGIIVNLISNFANYSLSLVSIGDSFGSISLAIVYRPIYNYIDP